MPLLIVRRFQGSRNRIEFHERYIRDDAGISPFQGCSFASTNLTQG
jgi:hypothetical protein